MNRAQTLTPLGNGLFAYRDDLPPCKLRRRRCSVLVFELLRYHQAIGLTIETPRQQQMARAAGILRDAWQVLRDQVGRRMTVAEIGREIGIKDANHGTPSRVLRRALDRLSADGSVKFEGYFRRLYWVEDA